MFPGVYSLCNQVHCKTETKFKQPVELRFKKYFKHQQQVYLLFTERY